MSGRGKTSYAWAALRRLGLRVLWVSASQATLGCSEHCSESVRLLTSDDNLHVCREQKAVVETLPDGRVLARCLCPEPRK